MINVLKNKVALQEKRAVQGSLGQAVTWRPVSEYFARIIPLDSKAISQHMQMQTEVSHRILLLGKVEIKPGIHRLLHGGRTFLPQQSARHVDGATEVVVLEA